MSNVYKDVNELFTGRVLPPITRKQATSVANRIYRRFGHKKYAQNPARYKRPVCTDNNTRRVWIDKKGINDLNKGWRRLIHDTSHRLFRRRYPDKRPHDPLHSVLELEVAQWVVSEFINKPAINATVEAMVAVLTPPPAPKVKPAKNAAAIRYGRVLERITQWERKQKRAATALKKLYKQKKYYERAGVTLQ